MGSRKKKTLRRPSGREPDRARPPLPRRSLLRAAAVAVITAVSVGGFALTRSISKRGAAPSALSAAPSAHYVGSGSCETCHSSQATDWRKSQHQAAMAPASDSSVAGDFRNARITHKGTTSTFFKRDGKFFVRTDGEDGKLADFEIRYTFGVEPLQQYLIELSGGRLQALSIAWDTRSKEAGGQRWFHLNPRERIGHDDELHWTRPAQNWNFMCADCHSTAVRKNYDAATNQFQTSWAEISVGCEACHGPGSRHVTWAADTRRNSRSEVDSTLGLVARFDERRGVTWSVSNATGNATRSAPRHTEAEIGVCAQCHSRRSEIAEGYEPGKQFLDYYRPALLSRPAYFADGQQRDEVYTWGSFQQSRMNSRGVTCSDCHNPHTGKVRAPGNAVCATCHLPAKYDNPEHHHHTPASTGASCAACHMPSATYMVVDPRHDHSFRIPRPDLSAELGTPNACTSCHLDRDARWAATQVRRWFGHEPQGYQRFGRTFAAADSDRSEAQALLRALASDETQPTIARATALGELSGAPSREALATITAGLRDANAVVRLGALESSARLAPAQRLQLAAPLLSDSLRAVRTAAASILAAVPPSQWSMDQRRAFQRASGEFIETQRQNADRAEARVNLGTFLAELGDMTGGQAELQSAIRLEPRHIAAYVNLADVYRGVGRDTDGERLLRDGLTRVPQSGVLHYALGLVLTRLNRGDSALHEFARAASLEPGNARFSYVHAIALHSAGKAGAAIAKLEATLSAHPDDGDVLSALAAFHKERGDSAQARRYRDRLSVLAKNR